MKGEEPSRRESLSEWTEEASVLRNTPSEESIHLKAAVNVCNPDWLTVFSVVWYQTRLTLAQQVGTTQSRHNLLQVDWGSGFLYVVSHSPQFAETLLKPKKQRAKNGFRQFSQIWHLCLFGTILPTEWDKLSVSWNEQVNITVWQWWWLSLGDEHSPLAATSALNSHLPTSGIHSKISKIATEV